MSNEPATPSDRSGDYPYRYTAALACEIEARRQAEWDRRRAFRTANPGQAGFDASKPKFFCMDMFPYPSGAGLHVGHPEGYTATDIVSRFKRMKGFNVLHPMGWDAFGLPAEQYAIQTGVHPAITTRKAIDTFRGQLKRFGFSYDWSREFATIDPDYYRWTQWIFLKVYGSWYDDEADRARPISELLELLERGRVGVGVSGELVHLETGNFAPPLAGERAGVRMWHEMTPRERRTFIDNQRLAYVEEQVVNWCPKLGTVLANEEVIDGKSERGGFPVFRRPLKQWLFKITAYAQRLIEDLKGLDWPASTRTMQEEWIGRSEGAEIDFALCEPVAEYRSIKVYTTRPDTLFGATYMVLAPEHPLVDRVLSKHLAGGRDAEVRAYVHAARNRSDLERQETKEKTGVFSGVRAVNPATGEKIPVWVADYVLMGYGHGAIMAVPGHDERDYEFAEKFDLPIVDVVYPRPVAAMHFFALNATPQEQLHDRWMEIAADLVGLAVTSNLGPKDYPAAMERIRSGVRPGPAPDGSGTAGPEKRGAIQREWTGMIQAVGLTEFDQFRDLFMASMFQRASGAANALEGYAVNSKNDEVSLNGLTSAQARNEIIGWLERTGIGRGKVNYRLRDWLFSRQRYWGEPFPIVFDGDGDHHPVDESALPVVLPELADFHPVESGEPQPLLAKATAWVSTTAGAAGVKDLPAQTPVTRETNTMPGWAGSCWYYLRYCDPKNAGAVCGAEAERYWMKGPNRQSAKAPNGEDDGGGVGGVGGVDLYIGGSEHAVLHLLYARFWHKVLFDLGYVSTKEPFRRLFHQGLITSYAYQREDKSLVPTDQVQEVTEGKFVEKATGQPVAPIVAKMSKSLKNVVNPDDVIAEFGADTFRLYEMYMGPLEASKPWNPRDITGCHRFLQRAWRLCIDEQTGKAKTASAPDGAVERLLHRTIAKVESDIERLAFNTAIAAMIEFVNAATGPGLTADQGARFALVLCPFAPHMAEELWEKLGREGPASLADWPRVDEAMLKDAQVELPVQIMGKVRARILVPTDADAKSVEGAALADPKVQEFLAGKAIKKVIVVPGKLVNVVVG